MDIPKYFEKQARVPILPYLYSMWKVNKTNFVFSAVICYLLQLDASLIEGEPFNSLTWKNKRRLNVEWQKFKYLGNVETGSKTCQNERYQCGAQSGVFDTHIFLQPPTHP